MAKILILGAGIAGHTAAMIARRHLPSCHEVTVVSPKEVYNWIPSNIWVGVGILDPNQVVVPLRPVYQKMGIHFHQARATEIYPEGSSEEPAPHVIAESTDLASAGARQKLTYDYLINATGPKLNFAATPGLGPEGFTESVCTFEHAEKAGKKLLDAIERIKKGESLTFVVGTGHGLCTCEGAAFEYVFNLEFELRRHGVRDRARVVFITNEADLGDFGVGGMHIRRGGYVVHSKSFAESLFVERGVEWITGAHVFQVEKNRVHYETLDGQKHELAFDFAMLLPPFSGVGMKAFSKENQDISPDLFAPSGFMKVDASYTPKKYEEWKPGDWPKSYQNPKFKNIYAVGIAFAPPHQISMPRTSANGTPIAPAPPRTGMPSAIMGRVVALNIVDRIRGKEEKANRTASLAALGAGCIASAGANWYSGKAASITMYPIVPDYERFPKYGRDLKYTSGDIGSAGHWIKTILHHMFMYKARAKPFWWLIPE